MLTLPPDLEKQIDEIEKKMDALEKQIEAAGERIEAHDPIDVIRSGQRAAPRPSPAATR